MTAVAIDDLAARLSASLGEAASAGHTTRSGQPHGADHAQHAGEHQTAERSDQIAYRKAKGSTGGRPPGFDAETYKRRNTVERSVNRFKQWRGLATRYDKYAVTYLGGVLLGLTVMTHQARS